VPPGMDAQRRLRESGAGTITDTAHTGSSGGTELGEIVVAAESNDTGNDTHNSAASAASAAAAPDAAAPSGTAAAATVKASEDAGRSVVHSFTFQLNPSKPCFVTMTSTERTDAGIIKKVIKKVLTLS